jgi:hypothetical protein
MRLRTHVLLATLVLTTACSGIYTVGAYGRIREYEAVQRVEQLNASILELGAVLLELHMCRQWQWGNGIEYKKTREILMFLNHQLPELSCKRLVGA